MNKFINICYENIIYVMYNCNDIIKEFIVEKKILNNDNILLNESIEITMKKTGIKSVYFFNGSYDTYVIPEKDIKSVIIPEGIETVININGKYINKLPLSVHTIYTSNDTSYIHPLKSHIKHIIINKSYNDKLVFKKNSKIESIIFGSKYNHPIDDLPNTIKKLCLGSCFNQKINKLPESLEELLFENISNHVYCHINSYFNDSTNFIYNMDLNNVLEKCNNLKNLCLPYNYKQPLYKLPKSLKKLTILTVLSNCIYNNDIILPPYLEEFNCENVYFKKNIIFPNTLQILKGGSFNKLNNFNNLNNLKVLKIKDAGDCIFNNLPVALEVLDISQMINQNINLLNLINLKELYMHNNFCIKTTKNENSLNLSSLTNLKKLYNNTLNSIDVMNLPNSLEDLNCELIFPENCSIKFPDSIKKLKLTISDKYDFIFPLNIEKLEIHINLLYNNHNNNKIVFLSLLNLSNTLKELDLSSCFNGIITFDKLVPEGIETFSKEKCIPDSLEILKLNSEYNTEIKNFPKNLKEIYFGESFNKSIKEISKCLMLKKVNFGNDFDKTIKYLPDSVEEINLGSFFKQKINKIPTNLKKIYFVKKHVNYYDFINKYPQINTKIC